MGTESKSCRLHFDVDASELVKAAERVAALFPPSLTERIRELLLWFIENEAFDVILSDHGVTTLADGSYVAHVGLGFRSDLELLGAAVLADKKRYFFTHSGITPEMDRAGIKALQDWISPDESRYSGWDRFAVRDVFARMYELLPEKQT